MKSSKLIVLVIVLIASFAFGQIYKWVDEEGNVNFGDCPPVDCEVEEVVLQQVPSDEDIQAAQEKLRNTLESRRAREAAEKHRKESDLLEKQDEEKHEAERVKQCVEAVYQLELLNQKRRIFKFQADGSRLYLENELRPKEISRLTTLRDEYCSPVSGAREEQLEAAHAMGVALSRRCAAARDTLEKMQQPGADPDEDKLGRYQVLVEAYCPDMESDHLWLGDWILINNRR